jgi:hypothetical protein
VPLLQRGSERIRQGWTFVRSAIVAAPDTIAGWMPAWCFRHLHRSLSYQVERELRRMKRASSATMPPGPGFARNIKKRLASKPGWFLSILMSLGLFLAFSCTYYIAKPEFVDEIEGWQNFVSDLWQVEASILGLALTVVVLLMQGKVSDSLSDALFQYYIEDSAIIPIVIIGLTQIATAGAAKFLMVQYSWSCPYVRAAFFGAITGFVIVIYLTGTLYQKTLKYLGPSFRLHALRVLLKEGSNSAIVDAAKRITSRQLLEQFCDEHNLAYRSTDTRSDLSAILGTKSGTITDIDLTGLARFAHRLRHPTGGKTSSGELANGLILKSLFQRLMPATSVLARICYEDRDAKTESICIKSFRIKEIETALPLREPLRALRSEISACFRASDANTLDEIQEVYYGLLDHLLISWDTTTLMPSISDLYEGIDFVALRVIRNHILMTMIRAIRSDDEEMISLAVGFPTRLLSACLLHDDPEPYQRLTMVIVRFYYRIATDRTIENRHNLVGLILSSITSFSDTELDFHISEKRLQPEQLARIIKYRILTTSVFNELIKVSIDNLDVDSFMSFTSFFDQYTCDEHLSSFLTDINILKDDLEDINSQYDEKYEKESRLHRLELIRDADLEIQSEARLVWFGIGAWILRQISNGTLSQDGASKMFRHAQDHLVDLEELSSLFLQIRAKDEKVMNWENWVQDKPPQQYIDSDTYWIVSFYCIQSLYILSTSISSEHNLIHPSM